MRLLLCLASASLVALSACAPEAANPTPEGWVESCYGGSFSANLNGSRPHLVITLNIEQEEWPRLYADLEDVGRQFGLDVFDSSLNLEHVEVFGVGLCSAEGLSVDADGRVHLSGPFAGRYDGVKISVRSYRDTYDWSSVAKALAAMIQKKWAGADVDWRSPRDEYRD